MKKKSISKKITIITVFIIILSMNFVLAERNIIDEYSSENKYIIATQQDVHTTINGDLFLITTESIIEGTINKDLNAISLKLEIKGIIGDDLRIISADTKLDAYVFNELMIISDILYVNYTTLVNGKTSIKATTAIIQGTYNDDVKINSEQLELDAIINGNAKITGNKITISPQTRINGNLEITEGANVPENTVTGTVTFIEKPRITTKALLLEKITIFLMILILAGVIHLIAQKPINTFFDKLIFNPIKTMIMGILSLLILPVISMILLISIITAPIGILLILALIALMIITPALAALLIGKQIMELIRTRREIRLEILIGALTLVMLSFIPGFMFFATILFYAFFLGTLILFIFPRRKTKTNEKKKTTKKKKRKK